MGKFSLCLHGERESKFHVLQCTFTLFLQREGKPPPAAPFHLLWSHCFFMNACSPWALLLPKTQNARLPVHLCVFFPGAEENGLTVVHVCVVDYLGRSYNHCLRVNGRLGDLNTQESMFHLSSVLECFMTQISNLFQVQSPTSYQRKCPV